MAAARWRYPDAAYRIVHVAPGGALTPPLPAGPVTVNAIGIEMPGIVLPHRRITLTPGRDWAETPADRNLTFVTVIERHGKLQGGYGARVPARLRVDRRGGGILGRARQPQHDRRRHRGGRHARGARCR